MNIFRLKFLTNIKYNYQDCIQTSENLLCKSHINYQCHFCPGVRNISQQSLFVLQILGYCRHFPIFDVEHSQRGVFQSDASPRNVNFQSEEYNCMEYYTTRNNHLITKFVLSSVEMWF